MGSVLKRSFVHLVCRGVACVAVLVVPAIARGQASSKFASAIINGWNAGIGVTGGWEDNLQFVNGQGVSAASYGVRADAAKLWRTRHDRIELSAGGGIAEYPGNPVLNQRTYDFTGGLQHNFTKSTLAQLRAETNSRFINQSLATVGTGIFIGQLIEAKSTLGSAAFSTQVRRGITATVSASAQDVRIGTIGFAGGQFASVGGDLESQLSRETTVGASIEYQYSRLGTNVVNLPVVFARAAHQSRSGFSLSGSAGAAVGPAISVPLLARIFGGAAASVTSRFGEFSGSARRAIGQQFGLESGLQITNSFGLNYSKNFTRAWSAGTGASYGWFGGAAIGSPTTRISSASLDTRVRLSREAAVSAGVFINRLDGQAVLDSRGATLGFSYRWSQSRRRDEGAAQ